jgi:hypothetical protein
MHALAVPLCTDLVMMMDAIRQQLPAAAVQLALNRVVAMCLSRAWQLENKTVASYVPSTSLSQPGD